MGELVSVNVIFMRAFCNFINHKTLTVLSLMRQEASPEVLMQMEQLGELQKNVVYSMLHLVTDKDEVLREYDKLATLANNAAIKAGMNPEDSATVITMREARSSLVALLGEKETSH